MATTYTDTQLLEEAREAMFKLVSRELAEVAVCSDSYKIQDLDKLQGIIDYYQTRVDQATSGFSQVMSRPERRR